jgi:HSP20 family molecular chaperone IbpA
VFEDSHAITLWADLPGVCREKLDIDVRDGSLSIEGEWAIQVGLISAVPRRSARSVFPATLYR